MTVEMPSPVETSVFDRSAYIQGVLARASSGEGTDGEYMALTPGVPNIPGNFTNEMLAPDMLDEIYEGLGIDPVKVQESIQGLRQNADPKYISTNLPGKDLRISYIAPGSEKTFIAVVEHLREQSVPFENNSPVETDQEQSNQSDYQI